MPQGNPKSGELYRHFKNKMYQIVSVAIHSETREKLVIYQALYDDYQVYARPYDMFISEVDHVKYPEVAETWRFTYVDRESLKPGTVHPVQATEKVVPVEEMEDVVEEEPQVNPHLLDFLDTDDMNEKYRILDNLSRDEITNQLIDTMAVSMDVVIPEGPEDERFMQLKHIIRTKGQYELKRFR